MSIFYRILISLSCLLLVSRPGWLSAQTESITATETDDPCVVEWIAPPQALPSLGTLTEVSADQLSQPKKDQFTLTGQAKLSQPGLVMLSDQLFYDRTEQIVRAFGSVALHQTDVILLGSLAEFNQSNQSGFLNDVVYQLRDSRAHGEAQRIEFSQQKRISELNKASFTTCPLHDQAWYVAFNKLEINDPKRRLYGYHSTLYFKDVPVLYTPYIDFPLDDRASGLLFPTIGSHKTAAQSQDEPFSMVGVPYYFNIAPNLDDTLTIMAIEHRGILLDNEFRYLSGKHNGQLMLGWINDQLSTNEGLRFVKSSGEIIQTDQTIEQRWRLTFNGQQNWGHGFSSNLSWHEVSDPDIYNDIPFGAADISTQQNNSAISQSQTTKTHVTRLLRQARFNYRHGPFQAHIQHYGYLPLRNGDTNLLEKHPEIGLNVRKSLHGFTSQLYLESTEFKRYSGFNDFMTEGYVSAVPVAQNLASANLTMGNRIIAQPSLQYETRKPYGFVQAQLKGNYREYHLINTPSTIDENSNNNAIQYALRGGLIFERNLTMFNHEFIQTLEPELQYLEVPFVDQSRLANFDTTLSSLDFSNLFQLNRFSGFDRIGDTKQIAVALSTKLLNVEGNQLAEAAIGQIFFLADRQISLNNTLVLDETPKSDYFVKLRLNLAQLYLASDARFHYESQTLTNLQNRLKWSMHNRLSLLAVHQGLNLDNKEKLAITNPLRRQQTLASGLMVKLTPEWEFASYVNYDIEQQQRRETATGLRYDSCCWASELIFEEAQLADGRYNYGVKYVIEFKGLSTLGNRLRDTIEKTLNF